MRTLNLITILRSLREEPRPLTVEEDLYLTHLNEEVQKAESDGARWRILEREGLLENHDFEFDDDLLTVLNKLHRATLN
jgi:hypothetical protein